jgi:hypothetical protein
LNPDDVSEHFQFTQSFQLHHGPGVHLASIRNEYHKIFSGGKAQADNLTTISEPALYKMWDPQRLTNLQAFTACYGDSFIL